MRRLGQWWRQPDHYEWLSDYLAVRGLTTPIRCILAGVLSTLALTTLLMMFSASGPRETAPRVVSIAVIAGFLGIAAAYLRRWPDRNESRLLSVAGVVGIALSCLVDSDPRAGLLGCVAFIGLAGYVGFFHCAHYLSLTVVISIATAVVCAARLGANGEPVMAVSQLLLTGSGILVVPFCGQVLVNWLSVDALKSSTDALTGLRNRRGFHRSASDLVANAIGDPERCFIVVMADLDAFKQANDTYGHAAGDMILVEVADSLLRASGASAVVGRIGGEEFLVAEIMPHGEAAATAERLRAAIASTSWNITASLGVSSIGLTCIGVESRELISGLIAAADKAMYEAKRAGGNQIRYSDVPTSWLM